MAMPKAIHDALISALKDSEGKDVMLKIGDEEKTAFEVIEEWEDSASAKSKVQDANKEISQERDNLKSELKTVKDTLTEKEAEVERLQTNLLSDSDKKKFEDFKAKGVTPDAQRLYEAKVNEAEKKAADAEAKLQEYEKTTSDLKSKLELTETQEQQNALKGDLRVTLAKYGIKDPGMQNLAINTIMAENRAKVAKKEDGGYERQFFVTTGEKELPATITELAEDFAKTHEALVESSGTNGTGHDHNSGGNNSGNFDYGKASKDDILNHASDMMEMEIT